MKKIFILIGLAGLLIAAGFNPGGGSGGGSGTNSTTNINLTGTNGLTLFPGTNVDDSTTNTIGFVDKGGGSNIQVNTKNVVTNGFLVTTSGSLTVNGGTSTTIKNGGSIVLNNTGGGGGGSQNLSNVLSVGINAGGQAATNLTFIQGVGNGWWVSNTVPNSVAAIYLQGTKITGSSGGGIADAFSWTFTCHQDGFSVDDIISCQGVQPLSTLAGPSDLGGIGNYWSNIYVSNIFTKGSVNISSNTAIFGQTNYLYTGTTPIITNGAQRADWDIDALPHNTVSGFASCSISNRTTGKVKRFFWNGGLISNGTNTCSFLDVSPTEILDVKDISQGGSVTFSIVTGNLK